ncbi:MAG: FliO/MopB family protein [Magnetococcales bacterium]|nr:FliO/MopB family protein [Magnetococcales bacterium]
MGSLTFLFSLVSAIALADDSAIVISDPPMDLITSAVRVVGFLLLFLIVAAVAVRIGRRWNVCSGKMDTVSIRVLGGHNFTPGVGVRVIQIGDRSWLIGITREHVSMLTEITECTPSRIEESSQ